MRPTSSALRTRDDEAIFAIEPDARPAQSGMAPEAAGAACAYEVITTRAGFDALGAEWNELFARAGRGTQLFQSFNWNWHWCNHYLGSPARGGLALALVTGRRAGRLVMVWPLVTARVAGLVQLAAMGDPVSQYSDALIETCPDAAALLRAAWAYVVAAVKPDLAFLPHVREDAAIAPLMAELGALPTQRLAAPYIDVGNTPDIDTYMRRHSAHSRKKYRAAGRRLAATGKVRFLELTDDVAAGALAAEAIDMKRRQLIERGLLSPAFADARLRNFFADAAGGGEHPTGTRLYAIECNGECIAANIVVTAKDTMLGHVFTYDSRFAKDSVGAQLLLYMFESSINGDYRTFDLMAPADDYKLRCADGTVGVVDWAIPVSAKGQAFAHLYLRLLRPLLKAAVPLTPERLRRALARRYYGRV
jgi:CelD/BcsL family acetyltransferase involved in cellulose biosynthesis